MSQIVTILRLMQIPQMGAQKIARVMSEIDLDTFCQFDKKQLSQIGWNERQIQRWFKPEQKWIEQALQWGEQEGQQLVSILDSDYPFLLKQISTAPPILFVKGSVESLHLPQIAMVGSRDYSHYGEYWAGYFASNLVRNHIAVTSGLAIGIDGFCHQGAIAENGVTIAVLGSGLAQIYPARHKKLAEQIIEKGGALVSEFLPHQPPLAENFPRRNRIISGLSLGTLVIEATLNSGSLITARYALEQGREVFALPNSVQNPYAQGCHKLIKEGALLTESVEDILQAIQYQLQPIPVQANLFESLNDDVKPIQAVEKSKTFAKSSVSSFAPKIAKNLPEMTACQQKIFAQVSLDPISIDDLAKVVEMNVSDLLVELLNLELLSVVKSVSGGYVRA